ncbi:hypothetical protein BDV93DRAFT_97559 [Ceratobasidium sp. AG-I]|nr:hypothetical protein BDV93DRAFT_97559 [Ceratobasidium sp. AG-I]
MAKSRKGKKPAKVTSYNNDNERLTREAQAHHIKNRGRQVLVANSSSDEEGPIVDNDDDSDNDIDVAADAYNAREPEDQEMLDWQAEMAEEEASMRELQEQLKRSRAKQAELRQLKQAATGAIPDAGSSRSKTASARAPATAPLRAPAAAPARTPAPAPPHAPVADPMQAPAAAAPTAVLAGNPPGGIKEPDPILFTGGLKWIPLPERKVDQTVKKIRKGLGASKGGPQVEKKWLDTLETVRQSIIRCNLDPSRPWKRQDPTKVGRLLPVVCTTPTS